MEESVDVKALRAKFNSRTSISDSSSRDSGSPKSPRSLPGRAILPVLESDLMQHRLSPAFQMTGQGMPRLPRPEPMAPSPSLRTAAVPRLPPSPAFRGPVQPPDSSRVRQTGEMLQSKMVTMHQRHHSNRPMPAPAPVPAGPSTPHPLRNNPRQRSAGDVVPLRRPLPPDGPQPLKPKRPPFVNLEPFKKFSRAPALPGPRKRDVGSPILGGRKMSLPVNSAPQLPQRSSKPSKLIRQVASTELDDGQETYDDIGSFDKNESWSDNSSQCMDDDNDDVYESIDEDQVDANRINAEKLKKKEEKMKKAQHKKEEVEKRKKENELKKNFQLQGEVEVLHTAKVRYDWYGGGKLDLKLQQGDSVEIIRVKNNPGGKWLARSLNGTYGYISNSCVDIDYEEVKRKVLQSRKIDTSPLPPPPPDPPQLFHADFNSRESIPEDDDDDYDDVQQLTEDFPPPPLEISIDPKVEKELRKKFKYEGPLKVLHTMMVNPNGTIKKPGGKDLPVTQGEVLDIIELTNSKKALCRNQFGKYGYVPRSLLLPMEGDIYDDVDYPNDIYDNDASHIDY